jgi:hypothetical protein
MSTTTFATAAEILAELEFRRTFIWDGDPTDWELAEMAESMADDGVETEAQIDAWLAEI